MKIKTKEDKERMLRALIVSGALYEVTDSSVLSIDEAYEIADSIDLLSENKQSLTKKDIGWLLFIINTPPMRWTQVDLQKIREFKATINN